jgi:hypothetical protein
MKTEKSLHDAIVVGDVAEVERLLTANKLDEDALAAILIAAVTAGAEMTQAVIEVSGVEPTPATLEVALSFGDWQTTDILCRHLDGDVVMQIVGEVGSTYPFPAPSQVEQNIATAIAAVVFGTTKTEGEVI